MQTYRLSKTDVRLSVVTVICMKLRATASSHVKRGEGRKAIWLIAHSYGHANITHSPYVYLSHLSCLLLAAAAAAFLAAGARIAPCHALDIPQWAC